LTERNEGAARGMLWGAFLVCFLFAGIPLWRTPYAELVVPNAFYGSGIVMVFLAAAVLRAGGGATFGRSLLVPALALPAALMARVVVEGLMVPGRHNLWPLALTIAFVLGAVVAAGGAVAGHLVSRVVR
jgi:hypothetical protein